MIKKIIFLTILFTGISFAANENSDYIKEIKTINLCPEKFIDYEITTDDSSFLENKNNSFFKNISYHAKKYKLKVYGSLTHKTIDDVTYYFVKTKNEDNKTLWLNTDTITLDPSLQEMELLKRIELNICGNTI